MLLSLECVQGIHNKTSLFICPVEPPSAPRNLILTAQNYSITINWSSPTETGGRSDLYYQVEYSDPDNLGNFTEIVYLDGESTSHTFTALRPYTSYCIRVSAHNGVSDQDPDRSQSRMIEECTFTPQDSKCFLSETTLIRTPHNSEHLSVPIVHTSSHCTCIGYLYMQSIVLVAVQLRLQEMEIVDVQMTKMPQLILTMRRL